MVRTERESLDEVPARKLFWQQKIIYALVHIGKCYGEVNGQRRSKYPERTLSTKDKYIEDR